MNYSLFESERIKLTAPRDGDSALMVPWYEDAEFMRNVDTDTAYPKTEKEIEAFIKEMEESKNDFNFHIRRKDTDALIGFVALDGVQWNNGCCMMAVGIGEKKNRGKGYGSEAMELILNFAFQELNLHRVGLNFISYNENAQRVYERAGFVPEGRVREFVRRDGEVYDLVYMGILRREWEARHS